MNRIGLCGLTPEEIFSIFQPEGFTMEHALKISNSLYKKGIDSFDMITGIPGRLKEILHENAATGVLSPLHSEASSDGTVKYLFSAEDGRRFETVYIPENSRHTVCVSSQSGCRMGCTFCATGKYGFHGNLPVSEIISQVISIPESGKVNRIVFMGMGEPMDNLDNVLKACSILTAEWGRATGARNVTVSTVGITPGIMKFLDVSDCNLAVSLFSPFPEERRMIVPAENKYPVHEIISLLKTATVKKKRRLTLSYVMIQGFNDSDSHLSELRRLLAGSGIRINLLPYHQSPGDQRHSSSPERMQWFRHELMTSGIEASIRKSRGADISAACGLLASGLR